MNRSYPSSFMTLTSHYPLSFHIDPRSAPVTPLFLTLSSKTQGGGGGLLQKKPAKSHFSLLRPPLLAQESRRSVFGSPLACPPRRATVSPRSSRSFVQECFTPLLHPIPSALFFQNTQVAGASAPAQRPHRSPVTSHYSPVTEHQSPLTIPRLSVTMETCGLDPAVATSGGPAVHPLPAAGRYLNSA